MSKILAVADIHINDYPNRNPSNRYRLYQTRTVAQNIIEAGKTYGCEYIVLAGDVVEHYLIKPYIQYEVKLFLDTIMANFREGYIIWGNHDLQGRLIDQDISDACLGVMLPDNLHYAHQEIINIDGKKIGFSNWMPEFDLAWISDKVDVLFTHATINYSPSASDFLESQKLDESKFDLAICGDIHRMATIGKYVSIGIPQRCKLSDSEDLSGVVYDCPSGTYTWVNLNPHDNLLKFKVTTDVTEQDRWDEPTKTWYVYKPENLALSPDQGSNLKVSSWDQVEELINDFVIKSGLAGVHGEILKNVGNIDDQEVDFNFNLIRLTCKNWRSIEDETIYFKKGDKIFLQGSNGSGKSSLLSALKYAFVNPSAKGTGISSLKPFVQFGKKTCSTEVEFDYQGNNYVIFRSSGQGQNSYGLWINGEKQKHASKAAFEDDIQERFKFISYLNDVEFFDSEHHRFIGGMSPDRRIEVMSKCLKLDRIDALHLVALEWLNQLKLEIQGWETKVAEVEKVLSYIDSQIGIIVLPKHSKLDLENMKKEGLDIQRKNREWNQYIMNSSRLQAQIQSTNDRLYELQTKQQSFRQIDIIDFEINQINQEIQRLNTRLVELGNIDVQINYKTAEYNRLRDEGNKAWSELQNLSVDKTCPHCGQKIKSTESLESHKTELQNKINEVSSKLQVLGNELNTLIAQKNNSSAEYNEIKQNIASFTSEVSKRISEKNEIAQVSSEIQRLQITLGNLNTESSSLGYVEKVELPDDFMNKMSEIEVGISAWNQYTSNIDSRNQKQLEKDTYQKEVDRLRAYLVDLERYEKLTGPIGAIYEEIMRRLSAAWSDSNIKYEVDRVSEGKRTEKLTIIPYYNKEGNFVNYFSASSGEKTIMDIDLLSKLISSSGLLVLDETLKNLDPSRLEEVCDILKNMNVGCLILTSHAESLGVFYNRTISLFLDDKGMTKLNG